jgi:hypothetical protein
MLRPIYVVRSKHAPERHLRKREGHQLTCSCQSKACAVDVNAHLGVHTAQGVENKELQTKWGVLLIGYMLSQRLRLIGQATKSDAAYSAALHKAWFLACIANACRSYALLGTTSAAINTSAAIKAWSLAGIAKPAAHAHSLAPPHQLPKPGLWHVSPRLPLVPTPWHHLSSYQSLVPSIHVSPTPAAHTHSLAPPRQLSPRLPSSQFELL